MAYQLLNREDNGPYPCYAGEFCGNTFGEEHNAMMEAFDEMRGNHHWISDRVPGRPDWTRFKKGRPRPCAAGTTEQLEIQGMYGLYLRHDVEPYPEGCEPFDGPIVKIPTPECLTEPARPARTIKTCTQRRKEADERNARWGVLSPVEKLAVLDARHGGPCGAGRQREKFER